MNEYRVAEATELFPAMHFTADPDLVVVSSVKAEHGGVSAVQKVALRETHKNRMFTQRSNLTSLGIY